MTPSEPKEPRTGAEAADQVIAALRTKVAELTKQTTYPDDPARSVQAMLARMSPEDKQAFNFCVKNVWPHLHERLAHAEATIARLSADAPDVIGVKGADGVWHDAHYWWEQADTARQALIAASEAEVDARNDLDAACRERDALQHTLDLWNHECGGQSPREICRQRDELKTALLHVSVTSSRYRSHKAGCQAKCTCDAIEDDKIVKNEIGRVIQRALARLTSAPAEGIKGDDRG